MVERCAEKGFVPSLVDGSDIQIDALSWLMQQHGIDAVAYVLQYQRRETY